MNLMTRTNFTSIALSASLIVTALIPGLAFSADEVTVYFTRHAEKQPLLIDAGDGHLKQPEDKKGAEELNEFGQIRAAALAGWFKSEGITADLTHIFSSQKLRTRQTIAAIAKDALGMNGDALATKSDKDYLSGDGIQQFPTDIVANDYDGRLETIDSPSSSVAPTVEALSNLPAGSVALVAMHSGTFYKILDGLGIDNTVEGPTKEGLFPKNKKGKISTFGDIWKVVLKGGEGAVEWRKNLQLRKYEVAATYTN